MTDQPSDRDREGGLQAPAERPAQADGQSATPEPWWGMPIGLGIFGTLVVGFFVFPMAFGAAMSSLIGLLMLGFAVKEFVSTVQLVHHGVSADGIVIGFEKRLENSEDEQQVPHFYPKVEFETTDHGKQVFTSDDGSRQASCRIGESVPVLFDPVRPHVARINKHVWGPIVTAAAFGTLFSAFGLWFSLAQINVLFGHILWE